MHPWTGWTVADLLERVADPSEEFGLLTECDSTIAYPAMGAYNKAVGGGVLQLKQVKGKSLSFYSPASDFCVSKVCSTPL